MKLTPEDLALIKRALEHVSLRRTFDWTECRNLINKLEKDTNVTA